MRFESPLFLLLLVLLPLFLRRKNSKHQKESLLVSSAVALETIPSSLRLRFSKPLLTIFQTLSFILLVIALARPQSGTQFTEVDSSGRDIILSLDISGSMQALDFSLDGERVTRLAALKTVVKDFIEKRKGDRIGITVFGSEAFTQCPLTLDTETLKNFIDMLEIGMSGKGTAIGTGIAVALKQIKNIESDSKVVILVTDGKSNAGSLQPSEAAKAAAKLGVKVHTVGIGGEGVAPFPAQSFFGQQVLVNQQLEFDEKTLKEIAQITGGKYFFAKDTKTLQEIYAEIDTLEEREDKTLEFIEYEEQFFVFAAFGLLCFLLFQLSLHTVFLEVP